jgi:Fe-S oxidoreductase
MRSVVAAGNPGCVAWMRRAAKDRGLDLEIVHPIMLLDRALQGTGAPSSA